MWVHDYKNGGKFNGGNEIQITLEFTAHNSISSPHDLNLQHGTRCRNLINNARYLLTYIIT